MSRHSIASTRSSSASDLDLVLGVEFGVGLEAGVGCDHGIPDASRSPSAGRGHGWIADQAMRASASVVLNVAEALGREGADRARALRIARGSALELDAALTLMLHRGACRLEARATAKRLTVRMVAMLTARRNRAAP